MRPDLRQATSAARVNVHPTSSSARYVGTRLAAGLIVLGGPHPAFAQGVRGVLRAIERATRPDSTRGGSSGTTRGSGAVASGGAVRVVDQQVTGSDSLARRFAIDTGVTIARTSGTCGVSRVCAPGWDLRVARVALPGPLVPTGGTVVITAEVENRGRQPAPPSEVRFCFAQAGFATLSDQVGCGRRMLDAVAVPALAPGEHALVRHAIELPVKDHEVEGWAVEAEVDPDNTLGEHDRSNNAARSAQAASRLPTLQMLTADVPAEGRAGTPLPITVAVRNTSTVATSPATELQLAGNLWCVGGVSASWGGGPNRVAVPALAPRQVVTYHLLVPDAARCRSAVSEPYLALTLDPDRRAHWGQGHEREIRRTYTVR